MNGLRRLVIDLWRGRLPLARVFWEFAVCYGTVANLLATAAALVAFMRDWVALGLIIHLLPLPYNFLMVISVWRSAARFSGFAIWATLARAFILVWAVFATLI